MQVAFAEYAPVSGVDRLYGNRQAVLKSVFVTSLNCLKQATLLAVNAHGRVPKVALRILRFGRSAE